MGKSTLIKADNFCTVSTAARLTTNLFNVCCTLISPIAQMLVSYFKKSVFAFPSDYSINVLLINNKTSILLVKPADREFLKDDKAGAALNTVSGST